MFRIFWPIGCKKKLRALFLPWVHLEKQQTRRKSARFYSWLRIFRDTSLPKHVFVNKHCCPFKFTFHWIILFSCLDSLSTSLSYHFSDCCFQSYMNIACRSTRNAGCFKWIWSLEIKCKRKWFWDLFLLVFIQTLVSSQWKFGVSLAKFRIGQLHDDVILLQLPESFSLLFSCAN